LGQLSKSVDEEDVLSLPEQESQHPYYQNWQCVLIYNI
jgi:hypothetical protein